jgi:hypothetical protein
MRCIVFLILVFFVCGCNPTSPNIYTVSEKQELANEVRKEAVSRLEKERDLKPFGLGAQMMYQIQMLALSFNYHKSLDIEQARELAMYASTVFLDIINRNEQIRPYLSNYPFDEKNIEIEIVIRRNGEGEQEKLVMASMHRGLLIYDVRNYETNRLKTIYRETYEEAAERLAYQNEQNKQKY